MPPREHIAKVGTGFSKILSMIKPGGVGGGGNSVLGTTRHLLSDTQPVS
jgi:hypothetical protein